MTIRNDEGQRGSNFCDVIYKWPLSRPKLPEEMAKNQKFQNLKQVKLKCCDIIYPNIDGKPKCNLKNIKNL